MDQLIAKRIMDIQEQLFATREIIEAYKVSHDAFLGMLSELTEEQRGILLDYFGICIELHLRMLEKVIEMK